MRRLDKDLVRRGDLELYCGAASAAVSNLPNWQNRRVRRRSHHAEKNDGSMRSPSRSFIVPPFHLPYPHATMLPPIALVATRNNK